MLCTFPTKPLALWASRWMCAGISLLQLWNTQRQRQVLWSWPCTPGTGGSAWPKQRPEQPALQPSNFLTQQREKAHGVCAVPTPVGCYDIPGACLGHPKAGPAAQAATGSGWLHKSSRFLHSHFKSSCLTSKMLWRAGKVCGTEQTGRDCPHRGNTGCISLSASQRTSNCSTLVVSPFAKCPCSQASNGESCARQVSCTAQNRGVA